MKKKIISYVGIGLLSALDIYLMTISAASLANKDYLYGGSLSLEWLIALLVFEGLAIVILTAWLVFTIKKKR
ncbi:MAG: hypothetical protein LKG11_06375 [Bacilli bacterium]|jgi:hypothetical protein|nr:hypothetical protein [Bacilli bacterium]